MDDRRNFYRVLHLQPDAPAELVRVNYRTVMQKLGAHPDLGGAHGGAVHVNAAYRTLSDPELRAAYDRELLERYDIQTLAQGRAKPQAPPRGKAAPSGVNQRNYYRVLEAQPDAPIDILVASHQVLCAQKPAQRALFDEALAILSDPARRRLYDGLLQRLPHHEAALRIQRRGCGSDYEPIIRSFCAFCKVPHARVAEDGDARCIDCSSPLFPPPKSLLGLARRAVARIGRNDTVTIHTDWPAAGVPGDLIDLSPTGMRMTSRAALVLGEIVKASAAAFDAVGAVAHAHDDGELRTVGLRFLTVRFPQTEGNFKSLKV